MKQNVTEIKLLIQNNSNASSVSNYTYSRKTYTYLLTYVSSKIHLTREHNAKLVISRSSNSGSVTKDNRWKSWLNTKRGHDNVTRGPQS